jgi:hypothetical protein
MAVLEGASVPLRPPTTGDNDGTWHDSLLMDLLADELVQ